MKAKTKRSTGGAPITVAEFLSAQIDMSEKTQKEIAEICGYDKPNIITMLKQGITKLPIPKVAPMAKALGVDPIYLLRIVLREYQPEILEAMEGVLGDLTSVNEREMLTVIRDATGNANPRMGTAAQAAELKRWAKALI